MEFLEVVKDEAFNILDASHIELLNYKNYFIY